MNIKKAFFWQSVFLSLLFLTASSVAAAVPSVVDSHSCGEVQGSDLPFILSLKKGEDLKKAILNCADAADLSGASISGLGAIENPRLHYYDEIKKENVYKTFPGLYELISLNGNIAFKGNTRVAHIHAGLGDHQYQMFGGDLESAEVGVLAEITFVPLAGTLIKVRDPATDFEILSQQSVAAS